MVDKAYTIGRKDASKKLQVSLRTVDRYISSKRVSSQKRHGRIYLNKEEIDRLRHELNVDTVEGDTVVSTPKSTEKSSVYGVYSDKVGMSTLSTDDVKSDYGQSRQSGHMESSQSSQKSQSGQDGLVLVQTEVRIFRELFERSEKKRETQYSELLQAWKRIAQLEEQVKNSVPLLEMKNEQAKRDQKDAQFLEISRKLERQIFSKNMYFILLLLFSLLIPLFLIFS